MTGAQVEQLVEALIGAYPDTRKVAHLVLVGLGEKLNHITSAELLSQLCFDLVLWAEKHEREAELILTAYEQNPGNVLLRRFAAEAGIAVRATEPIPDPLLNAHQRERLHEALLST